MNITERIGKLKTPHGIFIIYVLVCSLLIMLFRFIFPGEEIPLIIFSGRWRSIQGVLALLNLFPALALSALSIPFGIVSPEINYPKFSTILFRKFMPSVLTAICAAAFYALIFFLLLPLAKNSEENMRFKGELYNHAKEQMQEHIKTGEWQEASRYLAVCDQIWPENKDFNNTRIEIEVNLRLQSIKENNERANLRVTLAGDWRSADITPLNGIGEVNSTQALAMSERAFEEKRYFDAHWLATLGERLAARGSAEEARAAMLASDAWNMISSMAPNRREETVYSLYAKKLSGYQAMHSGDWIQAYYIFIELISLTPDDLDVKNFLAASERGAMEYAFFIDDMKMSPGENITGAVFSLPKDQEGRTVLRFASLSALQDTAYGIGLELMEFDSSSRLITNVKSSYAKLIPVTLQDKEKIMILTHALDRYDNSLSMEGEWLTGRKEPKGLILDISYEDFILLTHVRQGLPNLQLKELFQAAKKTGSAGYITQIFEAEILSRLGSAVFFLPMSFLVIIIGWRFRAKVKPRIIFILLLPVLPVVFHGFVLIYRTVFNLLAIALVLSIGFSAALIVFILILVLSTFASLFVLAAQHG